jgi:hypothetical protein
MLFRRFDHSGMVYGTAKPTVAAVLTPALDMTVSRRSFCKGE